MILGGGVGGAFNYTNQRQVLTVGSSDRIENTELAHSESNVRKHRLCNEVVKEGQVKVTGHNEDIGDADLDGSANKVATQSGLGRVDHGGVAIAAPFGRGCPLHCLQACKLKALRFWCPWIVK
ncbi:hypothetical protein L3X38_023580 [Prunus dulcis]|uniref:Uncharacterized protein n=1 Tax=Prunus dulcis TaxID=3755 RepID=A0AAD4VY32_PRUDU|nr:hypothetical protein L3X38_023580 [Prunus dulcis]